MKQSIPNLELNTDLAQIKQMEQSVINDKLSKVVKPIVTGVVLLFVLISCILFTVDALLKLPVNMTDSDKFMLVVYNLISNTMITLSVYVILRYISKGLVFLYGKLKG